MANNRLSISISCALLVLVKIAQAAPCPVPTAAHQKLTPLSFVRPIGLNASGELEAEFKLTNNGTSTIVLAGWRSDGAFRVLYPSTFLQQERKPNVWEDIPDIAGVYDATPHELRIRLGKTAIVLLAAKPSHVEGVTTGRYRAFLVLNQRKLKCLVSEPYRP